MIQSQDNPMKKGMVRSTISMLIPLEKQSEALEILEMVGAQIQYEPCCLSSQLYRGIDDVRSIMVEELWESYPHMLNHLRSHAYRRILMVIEMAEEPPDIRFETIAHTGGVEIIENARKPG